MRHHHALQGQVVEARVARELRVVPDHVQDRGQHQHATDHRVDEELVGGLDLLGAAPHADHHDHGYEQELPEHEEQEQVERDEAAHHRAVQEQEREAQILDPRLERAEGDVGRDRRGQRGQQDEPHAHAVDRHVVADTEHRDPLRDVLEVPAARHRRREQTERGQPVQAQDQEGEALEQHRRLTRQEQQEGRAQDGQEHDHAEQVLPLVRVLVRHGSGRGRPEAAHERQREHGNDAECDALGRALAARDERADRERQQVGRDLKECRSERIHFATSLGAI